MTDRVCVWLVFQYVGCSAALVLLFCNRRNGTLCIVYVTAGQLLQVN